MNRLETWKKQGKYKSFMTGERMILVNNDGATVLEPLYKKSIIKCEICGNEENMTICTSCLKSEITK